MRLRLRLGLDFATGQWAPLAIGGTPPPTTGGRVATRAGSPDALYLGGFSAARDTPYVLKRLSAASGTLAWTDETAAGGQGDYQPGFFYDPKRDRYLSLCGANNSVGWHCELRALEKGVWTPLATAGPGPQGRNGHFYVYDAETAEPRSTACGC